MAVESKKLQSQSTFVTLVRQPTGTWGVKMLKQKILVRHTARSDRWTSFSTNAAGVSVQVDGLTYELQEIYGIDGSVAAASTKTDGGGAVSNAAGAAPGGEIEIPDGAECIICMSEPRDTTVLPCRHMCLCGECAESLHQSSSTCPICRTRVEGLLQIRIDAKDGADD